MTLTNLAESINSSIPKVSYHVALIDFVLFSRCLVFYSIMEYALANWLMRIEKRIEAAAEVVEQESIRKETAAKSSGENPGTVVEPGEVQLNRDAGGDVEALSCRSTDTLRQRTTLSRMLSHAATLSFLKKRNVPAIKEHLCGMDRRLVNSTGHMVIRDQHLDIFSRYAYPFASVVGIVVFLSNAW